MSAIAIACPPQGAMFLSVGVVPLPKALIKPGGFAYGALA
jgi:hypothetical protein